MNDDPQVDRSTQALVRTFLIADIRGFSTFTHERGDEAAARLASDFADIARRAVDGGGGRLLELRGDEALSVFDSTRQALRTAVDLQTRFSRHSEEHTDLPLPVGIGIDAGEAIPVEGGYRGGALNVAARLCSLAGPGEILASEAVTHLARKVEGLAYIERGPMRLKGFAEPVRAVAVVAEAEMTRWDPEQRRAPSGRADSKSLSTSGWGLSPGGWAPSPPSPPAAPAEPETDATLDSFGQQLSSLIHQRVLDRVSESQQGLLDAAAKALEGKQRERASRSRRRGRELPWPAIVSVLTLIAIVVIVVLVVMR